MTGGKFIALRGFYLDGRVIRPGDIVTIEDRHLLAALMNANKLRPDPDTERRLQRKATLSFSEMSEAERQQFQPARAGAVLRPPMRN